MMQVANISEKQQSATIDLLPSLLLSIPLALILIWPYILNQGPIVFWDSIAYIEGAATGFNLLLGLDSPWIDETKVPAENPSSGMHATPDRVTSESEEGYSVSTARSPWYGAYAYINISLGGAIVLVYLQALSLALTVILTARLLSVPLLPSSIIVVAVAITTSAPMYASLLMPDVFASLSIIACINLLMLGSRMGRAVTCFHLLLLIAAILFHKSHLLVVVSLLPFGVFISWRIKGKVDGWASSMIAAAIVFAVAASAGYSILVESVYNKPAISPPFLSARLIADGPGFSYLKAKCPEVEFELCQHLGKMPTELSREGGLPSYSDDLLWSRGPTGVVGTADFSARNAMSDEDIKFAAAVLQWDPNGVFEAVVGNFARQTARIGLQDLAYENELKKILANIDASFGVGEPSTTSIYQGTFPLRKLEVYFSACAIIALLVTCVVIALLRHARQNGGAPSDYTGAVLLLLLIGVLLNAAITGGLSGPHHRYQSRVIWLLVLSACLAVTCMRRSRAVPQVIR